jgi:hypothetical protein
MPVCGGLPEHPLDDRLPRCRRDVSGPRLGELCRREDGSRPLSDEAAGIRNALGLQVPASATRSETAARECRWPARADKAVSATHIVWVRGSARAKVPVEPAVAARRFRAARAAGPAAVGEPESAGRLLGGVGTRPGSVGSGRCGPVGRRRAGGEWAADREDNCPGRRRDRSDPPPPVRARIAMDGGHLTGSNRVRQDQSDRPHTRLDHPPGGPVPAGFGRCGQFRRTLVRRGTGRGSLAESGPKRFVSPDPIVPPKEFLPSSKARYSTGPVGMVESDP